MNGKEVNQEIVNKRREVSCRKNHEVSVNVGSNPG
jgi:hypothetical protein